MATAGSCCDHRPDRLRDARFRRVLWTVLAVNAGMFGVELAAGLASGSMSLQADALDFFADAANYAVSLLVAGAALRQRARAALVKGAAMGLFGFWVLAASMWHLASGAVPEPFTMSAVGIAALLANAACAALLWSYRAGDSNMRSIWICSRNDALGNLAVLFAALGVLGTGSGWPDVTVACIIAALALQGSWQVLQHAGRELQEAQA